MKREMPQNVRYGGEPVLANFRPSVAERHQARQPSAQQRRPGNSPAHLAMIRQMSCTVCHVNAGVDPHHLKHGAAKAERSFGRRSSDTFVLPMCRLHHDEVEREGARGEEAYYASWGFKDACGLAKALRAARSLATKAAILVEAKHEATRVLSAKRSLIVDLHSGEWRRT